MKVTGLVMLPIQMLIVNCLPSLVEKDLIVSHVSGEGFMAKSGIKSDIARNSHVICAKK